MRACELGAEVWEGGGSCLGRDGAVPASRARTSCSHHYRVCSLWNQMTTCGLKSISLPGISNWD